MTERKIITSRDYHLCDKKTWPYAKVVNEGKVKRETKIKSMIDP